MCIYVKEFTTRVKACEADSPSGQKVGESRQWHQPCSQQQFSAKSSTLLTLFSEGGPRQINRGRGKPQQERETERSWKEKHIAGISHQPWPDFFLLLSSFCPSWLRVELFLELSSCVCVFSVLEVASPPQVLLETAGRVHTRGTEWEGMCRVKVNDCLFRIVTPAPLYKANSAYLLCLSKKATPSYCYTHDSLLGFLSHTLLDWVCLCIQALLTLPPPAMFHPTLPPPSINAGGKVGIKHAVCLVVVLWATKLLLKLKYFALKMKWLI